MQICTLSCKYIDYLNGKCNHFGEWETFVAEVCGDDFLELGTARICGSSVTENEKGTANGLARRMKNEPRNNTKSAKWIKRARTGNLFFPDNGRFRNVREELGWKKDKK